MASSDGDSSADGSMIRQKPHWSQPADWTPGESLNPLDNPSNSMLSRLPIVAVMGSGTHEHAYLAVPLGRWLATLDVHLLTGGGRGVMESVSRAFHEVQGRRGLVIGILPAASEENAAKAPPGYPNPWVEIAIRTHLPWSGERGQAPLSRNHINVLTSDVMIILPGGPGTASEAALALRYGCPAIAFGPVRDGGTQLSEEIVSTDHFQDVQTFVVKVLAGRVRPASL